MMLVAFSATLTAEAVPAVEEAPAAEEATVEGAAADL
jgi:hypothetical protein